MSRRKVLLAVFLLAGMSIWTACGTVEQKAEISQKTVETEETDEGEQTEQKNRWKHRIFMPMILQLRLPEILIWQITGVLWNIMSSRKMEFMTVSIRS